MPRLNKHQKQLAWNIWIQAHETWKRDYAKIEALKKEIHDMLELGIRDSKAILEAQQIKKDMMALDDIIADTEMDLGFDELPMGFAFHNPYFLN